MAISKVTLNGETLMDVTQDTVASNNLLTGETATGADGEPVIGAYSGGGGVALTLEVNVDTGSAVTVTNGTTTLTGTSANNKCAFTLPEAGTWTASATKDGQTSSEDTKTYTTSQSVTLTYAVVARTTPQTGISYTNGISSLSTSELNEIAMAISDNSGITSTTSEVWVSKYNRHLSTGDTTSISVSNKSYSFRILGFNHDELTTATAYGEATATGKAGITFQMVDCLDATKQMNSSKTNDGGWKSCAMRSTHLPSIKSTIAADWTGIMKKVNKKTSAGIQSSTINTVSDDLFLLSEIEIFGLIPNSYAGEGNIYAYWSANNTAAARVKNVNGSAIYWWERSPVTSNNTAFCDISNNGDAANYGASSLRGVAFGFCV